MGIELYRIFFYQPFEVLKIISLSFLDSLARDLPIFYLFKEIMVLMYDFLNMLLDSVC